MSDSTTSLALVPRGLSEAQEMSETFSKSQLLPEHFRGKPADVFLAISLGLELGLPPVTALQSVYVVHGRPGLYADAMVALVLASGLAEYFHLVEMTPAKAVWETKRRGAPQATRIEITIEQARIAGWASQNKKYDTEPDVMLSARAKSRLAKQVYPDVLKGIASVEEIRDGAAESLGFSPPPIPSPGQIIDVTEPPKAEPAPELGDVRDLARRITATQSMEELQLLSKEIKAVKNQAQHDELKGLYMAHGKRLRALAAPQTSGASA